MVLQVLISSRLSSVPLQSELPCLFTSPHCAAWNNHSVPRSSCATETGRMQGLDVLCLIFSSSLNYTSYLQSSSLLSFIVELWLGSSWSPQSSCCSLPRAGILYLEALLFPLFWMSAFAFSNCFMSGSIVEKGYFARWAKFRFGMGGDRGRRRRFCLSLPLQARHPDVVQRRPPRSEMRSPLYPNPRHPMPYVP